MKITYDEKAIKINDQRSLILSGAIHYPRSMPGMWPQLMQKTIDCGLNTIETYVFWNLHEPERGKYNFEGRLDLYKFCKLASEFGLNIILRVGPYICAETNYGGFPFWLRDCPGMEMRTYNQPFIREVQRWLESLCEYLRPMFAPNGGPIIMTQIENEYDSIAKTYGINGEKYLKWCYELAQSLNLQVPLIMCSGAADNVAAGSKANLLDGASEGTISTMNSHYAHEMIERHRTKYPDQPALWTEMWTGWYDIYGYPHHIKSAENLAYSVARFFAAGGTGVNYYMWHGGTNFARETMYLQTTSYDFNAPLDEFGNETTKYYHLKKLHFILKDNQKILLSNDIPQLQKSSPKQYTYLYQSGDRFLAFLCNDDSNKSHKVEFKDVFFDIKPRSVIIINDSGILMDTSIVDSKSIVNRQITEMCSISEIKQITSLPSSEISEGFLKFEKPMEQLLLTKDNSDYCWYSTKIDIGLDEVSGKLILTNAADIVHVFINDKLYATTQLPLAELRGEIDGDGFRQVFDLELQPGTHELSILCCSLGLIKGDWMLGGQNMVREKKGLWGKVFWGKREISGQWKIKPGLNGLDGDKIDVSETNWQKTVSCNNNSKMPLTWYKVKFILNEEDKCQSVVADMGGMNKGLFWLNGQLVGRYWLVKATGLYDAIDGTFPELPIRYEKFGEPTQRYYHLPSEWLKKENTLVLFEELGGEPDLIKISKFE